MNVGRLGRTISDIDIGQDDTYTVCNGACRVKNYYCVGDATRQFRLAYRFVHVHLIVGTMIPVFRYHVQCFDEFSVDDLIRRLTYRSQKNILS